MTTPDITPEELHEAAQRARESVDSWPAFLFDRAADELERLRAQVASLSREAWTWSKALEAQLATPSLTVGDEPEDERGLALWQLIYGAIAHEPLPLKVAQIEAAAKRVEDMLKRRAASKPAAQGVAHAWREALERIADPRNTHFAGDAQVVARAALAAAKEQP